MSSPNTRMCIWTGGSEQDFCNEKEDEGYCPANLCCVLWILRYVTICLVWTRPSLPIRSWRQLWSSASPFSSTSLSDQDLLTVLCLFVWVSQEAAHPPKCWALDDLLIQEPPAFASPIAALLILLLFHLLIYQSSDSYLESATSSITGAVLPHAERWFQASWPTCMTLHCSIIPTT